MLIYLIMLETEILQNLSKIIGMEPSHLLFFIIAILISLVAILIAVILDSKEISGFNFDAIIFRRFVGGVKSINKVSENLNILRIQSFIKGKPSVTSTNAQIIQLAIWGYIEIKKDGKKVEIRKTLKDSNTLPPELQKFLESLFAEKDIISNERKLIDTEKRRENFKLAKNLETIFKDLSLGLEDEGFYKNNYKAIFFGIKILALIVIFISTQLFNIEYFYNTYLSYALIVIVLVSFSIILLGKKSFLRLILSNDGIKYLREIQGVYLYIKTAETDRINFHNNPKEYKDSFMDLLPYALLFGMSDKWLRHLPLQTVDWGDDIWSEDFTSW